MNFQEDITIYAKDFTDTVPNDTIIDALKKIINFRSSSN